MAKYPLKKVSFKATRIKRIPTRVSFRTKSGRRVSFRATRIKRIPTRVSFYARKKRR